MELTDGKKRAVVIALSLLGFWGMVVGVPTESDTHRLMIDLLEVYDVENPPVLNRSHAVVVTIDVALRHIIEMDEVQQIIRTSVWLRFYWKDEYLTWNKSDYGGADAFHVFPEKIWKPDITIYNNVKAEEAQWPDYYMVHMSDKGEASWLFPYIMESSCRVDVANFPFDEQSCEWMLGSWSYHGFQVDVHPKNAEGDKDTFLQNGEWFLQGFPTKRSVGYYNCCPEPYPSVTFTCIIKRRSLFFLYNLIVPCIFFTLISLLTFLLPVDSGEKISLNVTILLALDVFLLIIMESMPPQSDVIPVIGQYFGACIVTMCMSTMASVYVIHLYYKGSRGVRAPEWVRRHILGNLGRVLGYSDSLGMTGCQKNSSKVEVARLREEMMVTNQQVEMLAKQVEERDMKLNKLRSEKKKQKDEYYDMKQEVLKSAICEKDANIALVVMTGNRMQQNEEVDKLQKEKEKLQRQLRKSMDESNRIPPPEENDLYYNNTQSNHFLPPINPDATNGRIFQAQNNLNNQRNFSTTDITSTSPSVAYNDDFGMKVMTMEEEWRMVSLVMDRLFFIGFACVTFSLTVFALSFI